MGLKGYMYIYKVFQNLHPTLVIKSVPQFWHKGVGKANHVTMETTKKKQKTIQVGAREREGGGGLQAVGLQGVMW